MSKAGTVGRRVTTSHRDLQLVYVWVSRLTTTTNSVPMLAFVRVRTFTFAVWLFWIMLENFLELDNEEKFTHRERSSVIGQLH